jgi:glucose/arabinose dehydrogenase
MKPSSCALSAGILPAIAGSAFAQVALTRTLAPLPGPATVIAQPPGEPRRLYAALRFGQVRVARDGILLPTPVLQNLPGLVTDVESGLLGLAFHPQFQQNGFMFVLYQTTTAPAGTRIARYTLSPSNPEIADPASARAVLTISRDPYINHQAGWLGFGPDGYLYISSGNAANDTLSQDDTQLLGKMLRIDVDHDAFPADGGRNYAIPPTNPFAGSPTLAQEIWATGLRNPWRCSFDRLTGDLWIGDVGDSALEEIDLRPAAPPPYAVVDYGYPCMEGTICRNTCPCDGTLPYFVYDRSLGFANVGGYLYRGRAIPALRGTFIGADLGGMVYSFRPTPQGPADVRLLTSSLGAGSAYALGEDQAGELYLCTAGNEVYRITPACPTNCDGSTAPPVLNVSDFSCFLEAFAAGDLYANCDNSTAPPALNVADFTCYLQRFAAGCP